MYGIVKCLPTSRRKSSIGTPPSQSWLSTMRAPRGPGREVQEALTAAPDRGHVAHERRGPEQRPLARPPRGIPDHARRPAHHGDRPAAVALEVEQPEHRHEVADVERVGRRVEARVAARSGARRPAGPRSPGVASWSIPRQRSSSSKPGSPRVRGRAGAHRGAGQVATRRPGRRRRADLADAGPNGGSGVARALCYRAARHADQPRTAAAPSPHGRPAPARAAAAPPRDRRHPAAVPVRDVPPRSASSGSPARSRRTRTSAAPARPQARPSRHSSSPSRPSSTTAPAEVSWPGSATTGARS